MIKSSSHMYVTLLLACGAIISHIQADTAAAAAATTASTAASADDDGDGAANPYIEAIISAPEQHLRQTATRQPPHEPGALHPALHKPLKRHDIDPPHKVHAKVRARTKSLDDVVASHHHSPTISRPKPITGEPRAIPKKPDESVDRMWIELTRQLLPLESSDTAPSTLFALPSSQPTYSTLTPSFEPAPSTEPNGDAEDEPHTQSPNPVTPRPPTPRPLPLQPTSWPVQAEPSDSVGSPGNHQHSAAPTLRNDDSQPSAHPNFAHVTTLSPSSDAWSPPVAIESTAPYSPTYKPSTTLMDAKHEESSHLIYKPTYKGDDDLPNYPPTDAPSFFPSAFVFPSGEDHAYRPTPNYDSPAATDKPIALTGAPSSIHSAPPVVSPPLPAIPPSLLPSSSSTVTPTQCPQPSPEPSMQRALRMTTTPTQNTDSLPTSSSTAAPTQCPQPSPEPSVQRALRKTNPTESHNSLPTSSSTATPTQCPQPTPEPAVQRPVRMTTLPTQRPITTPTRVPTIQIPTQAPASIPTRTKRVRPATQSPTAENSTTAATFLPTFENTINEAATDGPTNGNTFKAPTLSMPTTESSITSPTQKSPAAYDPSDAPTSLPTAGSNTTESPTSNSTTALAVQPAQVGEASSSASQSSSLADNSAIIPFILGIGGITAIFATMALNARRNAAA